MGYHREVLGIAAKGEALAPGRWFVAAAMSYCASACSPVPGFGCNDDAQCIRDDLKGHCETIGFCAYPDAECPSGARFSPHASAPYTGQCTPIVPETTTDDGGEVSGSETGSSQPVCGNGIVEEGEECDDGNQVDADGCNSDCRRSGTLIESFVSDLDGNDRAYDIVLLPEGDVVVAASRVVEDNSWDILVIRYDWSGDEVWRFEAQGSAGRPDQARSIASSPSGNVLVTGYLQPVPEPDEEGNVPTAQPMIWLAELDVASGEPLWTHMDGAPPPSIDQGWDATYDATGGIVVAGRVNRTVERAFGLRRYSVDLDDGEYVVSRDWAADLNPLSHGFAVLVDPRGNIVAGGNLARTTDGLERWLEAFTPDGLPFEPRCSSGSTAGSPDDVIFDLALAPDGHIAAAGFEITAGGHKDAWVGWYEPEGCKLVWNRTMPGAGGGDDAAQGVVVDSAGNIVTVGYLYGASSGNDLWVAKWNPNKDPLLWQANLVNGPGNGDDQAWSVVLTPEREIVVVGYISKPGESDIWVGRFTE